MPQNPLQCRSAGAWGRVTEFMGETILHFTEPMHDHLIPVSLLIFRALADFLCPSIAINRVTYCLLGFCCTLRFMGIWQQAPILVSTLLRCCEPMPLGRLYNIPLQEAKLPIYWSVDKWSCKVRWDTARYQYCWITWVKTKHAPPQQMLLAAMSSARTIRKSGLDCKAKQPA